jgi:membrane protein implicated in regulation of membrane protease activity
MNMGKKRRSWPTRVLVKYLLIQFLSWVLWTLVLILVQHWIHFPGWVIPAFIAVWVAKDIIMFPFVWRAYDSERGERGHPRAGAQAVVVKKISPAGYVRIDGELWRAETAEQETSIPPGETVTVEGIKGLTLLVRPSSGDTDSGADSVDTSNNS